ncbi:DegT/DnrJ/EryC1/StrS family aminotransferase [uncultured Duncaniella sp.]|uniref:DegT/DnrJ/EryC1/StrS family aminotransferase n=1 Tax=uncultured Duncaniella sp. TaxID=2768039 RepID=UPI0026115064|nr:DegT/DnrJ/EryC1/StrS family aminotransferase [uncultured Duncaniella sp.]
MNNTYPFLDLKAVNARYEEELIAAATRVIKSGRYIGGEEVDKFEQELCDMTGAAYAVGVSNGLDALRLILRAYKELGIMTDGDEVIVPGNTYIASVLAITDAGLTPVLVDPSLTTFNIDTAKIEKAVTPRTRAIMTVHLYGRTAWDETMAEIARKYGLKIIEDSAQAIGACSVALGMDGKGRRAGALGHASAFSFYPTKNVGALGDAGAVTTSDNELAKAVRALANYGSDRRYHNIYVGANCRLDPMQAAMLRIKLGHTAEENADRFARALAYHRTINHEAIICPMMSESVTDNVWHQYVIRVTGGKRDEFRDKLLKHGVATDVHYAVPPHKQPCYQNLKHGPLPVTELLANEVVSLPIGTGTSVKDAATIAEIINSIEF